MTQDGTRPSALVTDEEYARAQEDPDFRHKLMVDKLDLLLEEIARLRATQPGSNSPTSRQIREGVVLAVKLADMLQKAAKPTDAGTDAGSCAA